jgi:poly(A) polymerase
VRARLMNLVQKLEDNSIFRTVQQASESLGIASYVVGGYVRDLILKRPSKDIDFVTVGSGIELAKKVAEMLGKPKAVQVFKNFGTAMIKIDGWELEFVGARKESYQRDSRKPIVEDGTLEDDQNRRDFTINAMAISLNQVSYGDLIDPFDGVKDLKRKMVKTPLDPDVTFSDDPLRMMRAIRFATQLGFDIAPDTFDGIVNNANRLKIISAERIIDELNKIILADQPSYGFKLLYHSGLLKEFFPEMVALQGVDERDGQRHKDNFYHTLEVLDNVTSYGGDLWLRWAAILHDIAKPPTKRFNKRQGWTFHGHEDKGARMVPGIFKRLKLPLNDRMKYVQKLVRLHLRPIPLVRDNITDTAVRRLLFDAGDDIENFPKRDATTIARVAELINNMNVDLIALQEIDEPSALDALLEALPGWLYKYQDVRYGQEVGFLYKTSEITSISDLQMIYSNESSPFPRQPVLTTVTHSNGQEVTLINIHLKCCGGNENESRREQASILLKKYIDDNLATNKVILLGDFNGEINDANSEFSNFIADDSNYKFADMEIAIGDYEYWSYPNFDPNGSHIDHILITDELFDEVNFVSTMQLDECISSFDYYISDHRPILISLN